MSGPVVEVYNRKGENWRVLFAVGVGLVALLGSTWFWFSPPLEPIWGNSAFVPRLLAAIGYPTGVYFVAWGVWHLLQRGPVLILDSEGLMSKLQPFRVRRVRWENVGDVAESRRAGYPVLDVTSKGGQRIKLFTAVLEEGWNAERLRREIGRLSGGRVR